MNEDRKMVISAKGYTETVKQMQDLSRHIKTVYYNKCIAEEYKSYWILSSHHLEQLECQKIMINRALGVSDKLIASDYIGLPMGDNIHANLKEINKRITELSFERTISIGSWYI